jgi:hypothetical protein
MNEFGTYIIFGFKHIADVKGYDHILFIITLCCIYSISEWKNVLILVTAFTIGHSITLALAALKVIIMNSYLIELLIPITILATSILNLFYNSDNKQTVLHYMLALFFGCIHGMGFSNFFNAISMDNSIIKQLLGFNIGLEMGQILIIFIFFTTYAVISLWKKINPKDWRIFFSGAGASTSLALIIERI